jgi:hypothetical protein
VGEIQTADDCSQRGIIDEMLQHLGEDNGVGNRDVTVENTESCRVQSSRCQ